MAEVKEKNKRHKIVPSKKYKNKSQDRKKIIFITLKNLHFF